MPGWQHHKPRRKRNPRFRPQVLAAHPTCECPGCHRCSTSDGCTRPSTEADHIIPLEQGGTDHPTNGAGKCTPCHAVKSAREGNAARKRTRRGPEPHPGLAT